MISRIATVHTGIKEEDLESDVELVERSLPIPGNHCGYERFGRSEPIATRTLSDQVVDDDSEASSSSISSGSASSSQLEDNRPTAASVAHSLGQPHVDGRTPHVYAIPRWFPPKIKKMYRVDRKGGSLRFKVRRRGTR
jgi:hypothetical protein